MIGRTVGQYKILEKLGEGGMGAVYRAVDVMIEREVAIKMLRPEIARQPDVVERFRSEAKTLAMINSPGIAMLYSFFRDGNDFFMVMEFVRGRTMEAVIREAGAMPWRKATALFTDILTAIEPAHRIGVLHRDIKPANIMLTVLGSIKVMDFGIARALGTARMTREGRMVGTLEYISPERVKGKETDVRSDIYSLGVVFYEMLSGHLPFESDSEFELMREHLEAQPPPLSSFGAEIPRGVEAALMRALAKAPEERYQSCSEFAEALQTAMGERGPVVRAAAIAIEPAIAPPPHSRETRLGRSSRETPTLSPDDIETRYAPAASNPALLNPAQAPIAMPVKPAAPPPPAAGPLSGIRWIYAAGAGLVAVLAIGAAVLFLTRPRTAAPPPKTVAQAPAPQPAQQQPPILDPNSALPPAAPPAQPADEALKKAIPLPAPEGTPQSPEHTGGRRHPRTTEEAKSRTQAPAPVAPPPAPVPAETTQPTTPPGSLPLDTAPSPAPKVVVPAAPDYPQSPGIYYKVNGAWSELSAEGLVWRHEGLFKRLGTAGIGKGSLRGEVQGGHSPTRTPGPVVFLIRTRAGGSVADYTLLRLHGKHGAREFHVPAESILHPRADKEDLIPFSSKRIGDHLFYVTFSEGTGDYGFLPPGARESNADQGTIYTFRIGG
jgi:eukaryotic-like serine/threonine-protein kinase